MQGEPIPDRSEEAALPEGLKREPNQKDLTAEQRDEDLQRPRTKACSHLSPADGFRVVSKRLLRRRASPRYATISSRAPGRTFFGRVSSGPGTNSFLRRSFYL
jgi:hypothetical protein